MLKFAIAAAGLMVGVTNVAGAATITKTISFITTDFVDTQGLVATPPFGSVSGSFTVTFDPTMTYINDTSNLNVTSFTGVPVGSAFAFSYYSTFKFLFFGGLETNSYLVAAGTADYLLTLDLNDINAPRAVTCADPGIVCGNQTGNSDFLTSGYTTAGSRSIFFERASATRISSDVPEPASWAMMLMGFGMIGAALRRRKITVNFA